MRHHPHHHHHDHFPRPEQDLDPRAGRRWDQGDPLDPGMRGPRGGGPGREGRRAGTGPRGGFDPRQGFGPGEGFDPREGFGPRGPRGDGPRGSGRGRGPRRAPRGDVRVAVLLLLAEEPMHGYQLMQTISERTGGRWSPSPGAIYPTLSQLEDEGLVVVTKEGGRKLATLTQAGTEHVAEHRSHWADPFPEAPTDEAENPVDLRGALHELAPAIRTVARSGTDAQIAEAQRILTEARQSLYRLLAGDAPVESEQGETDPQEQDETA